MSALAWVGAALLAWLALAFLGGLLIGRALRLLDDEANPWS